MSQKQLKKLINAAKERQELEKAKALAKPVQTSKPQQVSKASPTSAAMRIAQNSTYGLLSQPKPGDPGAFSNRRQKVSKQQRAKQQNRQIKK